MLLNLIQIKNNLKRNFQKKKILNSNHEKMNRSISYFSYTDNL